MGLGTRGAWNRMSNLVHLIFPSQFCDSCVSDNSEKAEINIQAFECLSRGIQIKTSGLLMGNGFFLLLLYHSGMTEAPAGAAERITWPSDS